MCIYEGVKVCVYVRVWRYVYNVCEGVEVCVYVSVEECVICVMDIRRSRACLCVRMLVPVLYVGTCIVC